VPSSPEHDLGEAGLSLDDDHRPRALERVTDPQVQVIPPRPYLAGAEAESREGVVLVGVAQEKVNGWRGFKDSASPFASAGHPHFTYRRQALYVNPYYFYLYDADWGPASRSCARMRPTALPHYLGRSKGL